MLKIAQTPREPGRPTLKNSELMGRRDRLVWFLSVSWGDIGWELPRARNREELYEALAPVRGHSGEDAIALFVCPTSASTTAQEIRQLGKKLGKSVDRMYAAQQEQRECTNLWREADAAIKMNQVKDAPTELNLDPRLDQRHRNVMVEQFKLRETKLRYADAAAAESGNLERTLRAELEEKQAAFAQAELLDYITKKEYARDPLGLANAMAGLPDLGWDQSRDRCSKIKCSGWPNVWFSIFETIQDIWKLRIPSSELSIVDLFRREVEKLPKKTLVYYEPEKRKMWMPNQVRSRLAENFRMLRLAIEGTLQSKMHPGRTPFKITSLFEKNIEKPRPADESLQIAHERIE